MPRHPQIAPVTSLGNELVAEVIEIKEDLERIQREARNAGDWKKELAVLDKRIKLVELRLREAREHSISVMSVNFDIDEKAAEKMALAFLAKQRTLKAAGESDGQ